MAVIWKKITHDKTYEVRTAGNSVRLYTNGVFHTQYNPKRPFSGQVWDLLSLPSLFFTDRQSPTRVLILGVGGGAVIKQLQYLHSPITIVGVELNPVHLTIAKRFFQVKRNMATQLVQQDAVEWVTHYQGKKFDYIVDDLFCDSENIPQRAIPASREWINRLSRLLTNNGILTINFADQKEFSKCSIFLKPGPRKKFKNCFSLNTAHTYNRIGVFSSIDLTKQQFRHNLNATAASKKYFSPKQLRLTLKKVKMP